MNLRTIFKIPNVSEIDNLAYRLYWKEHRKIRECSKMFFGHKENFNKYYEEAIIMLRKEKIKQLKENICLKKVI